MVIAPKARESALSAETKLGDSVSKVNFATKPSKEPTEEACHRSNGSDRRPKPPHSDSVGCGLNSDDRNRAPRRDDLGTTAWIMVIWKVDGSEKELSPRVYESRPARSAGWE